MRSGLTTLIGYTWSRAMDNGSAIRGTSGDPFAEEPALPPLRVWAVRLQLRCEMFNSLNHPQWGLPNVVSWNTNTVTPPATFARISTTANDMSQPAELDANAG